MSDTEIKKILSKLDVIEFKLEQKPSYDEVMNIVSGVVKEAEDRLMTHIDGFITLHQTLNQEVTMLRNRCDQLEERLLKLESQQK